jgi:hypothetical protein
MSLLATASPWNNNDDNKKRTSTMRKTVKKLLPLSSTVSSPIDIEHYEEPGEPAYENFEQYQQQPVPTIAQSESVNDTRKSKVNDLLNKMTNVSADNDGSKLANYNPPPKPILNNKKPDASIRSSETELKPHDLLPVNNLQPNTYEYQNLTSKPPTGNSYGANDIPLGNYSNYNKSYDPSTISPKPYYAKMGISGNTSLDDRLMEKINYMIHLLEEQQNEKTNNITEEFILYTFLGVFMIFVLDSFARSGKYVR